MEKEEAKKILSGYVKACNEDDFLALEMFEYEKVIEAMTIGANALSEPSLPSNLYEAAEEYAEEFGKYLYGISTAFKAGAEWMAELGINIESNVVLTQEEDTCRPYLALQDFGYMPAPKFCKESDKVIVQIRKK